ncbi:hypothetical protein B5X24_HaOG201666 [Helicoverpa armigera]|nr:hypothetical protein B5X24_HaOG201666 [Helicoverpa armigera]
MVVSPFKAFEQWVAFNGIILITRDKKKECQCLPTAGKIDNDPTSHKVDRVTNQNIFYCNNAVAVTYEDFTII